MVTKRFLLVCVCVCMILGASRLVLPSLGSATSAGTVIDEAALGGTLISGAEEWIGIPHGAAQQADLTARTLASNDDYVDITLEGTLASVSHNLLERVGNGAISDVSADQAYTGLLNGSGRGLTWGGANGAPPDSARGAVREWLGGTISGRAPTDAGIERRHPPAADGSDHRGASDGQLRGVLHVEGNSISGPPRAPNSAGTAITSTSSLSDTHTPTPTAMLTSTPTVTASPSTTSLPTTTVAPAATVATTVTLTATVATTVTPTATVTTTVTPTATLTSTLTPTATLTGTPTSTATLTSTFTPIPPSSTPALAPTGTSTSVAPSAVVVVNEVFYNAPGGWSEPEEEWFELHNNTPEDVDLGYWRVEDNNDQFTFPEGTIIPAHGYLVLAYDGAVFQARWGITPLSYGLAAANIRLANDGDRLLLRAPSGLIVDSMSYGDDYSELNPPCPDVAPGHSLEREPAGFDTGRAADFVDRGIPSPGGMSPPTPTPTATPSAALSPTPSPTASLSPTPSLTPTAESLLISEVCYDGVTPDAEGDEFLELHNPLNHSVSLAGYRIGDEETQGGSEGMYRLPATESIGPGEVVVIAKNAAQFQARFGLSPDFEMKVSGSGYEDTLTVPDLEPDREWGSGSWALSNSGDEVLLLGPGDVLVDAMVFKSGQGEAVGVSGTLSAPAPRSLQRVLGPDNDDMPADFLIAEPSPGQLTEVPAAPITPPPSADLGGGMRAYWGCMHSHSTYSDGSGPPRYAYAVGRANGLHFLALTDHSHMVDAQQWADLGAQAAMATEDGDFVALRGFEWTSREEGHISVFNTSTSVSRDDAPHDTLAGFYPWLAAQERAIAQFEHPFAGDFAEFSYDQAADNRIALLEVGNGGGMAYRRFEEAYLQALGAGWRVGPSNSGDTESPDWGADTPHRTGVVAASLTEMDLLDALQARRTFATEDSNLALALRAGGKWMGETLDAAGEFELTLSYRDADGESAELGLYNRTLRIGAATLSADASWVTTVSGLAGHFYWARAQQTDGDLAYTSPIWVPGVLPPEKVFLNELCPAPLEVDWDGSGSADPDDEWIELYNRENHAVGLGGWRLDDEGQGGSAPWTFPLGWTIPPRSHLVLFKRDSGVALNDSGDSVRLLRPDGSVADEMSYPRSPGYDRTWSRTEDGGGEWTWEYEPTMGEANKYEAEAPSPETRPAAPIMPQSVTLAQARVLPADTLVVVQGQVTVPPGVLKGGTMYIQDAESGMKVYLSEGSYSLLQEGDWVQVEGKLSNFHGEREITVSSAAKVRWLRSGAAVGPAYISTGQLAEAFEGLLVEVAGRVSGWDWDVIYLDDGSGVVEVYFGRSQLVDKPWVEKGELYLVGGVASQYASARPYEGGYRILPRYRGDVISAPVELPITGVGLLPDMWK